MKTETIEEEIQINGSRKINIGVRCYPELKNKLAQEATDLGITLSEHTENSLLNKDVWQIEKEIVEKKVEALEEKVDELEEIVSKLNILLANKDARFNELIEKKNIEISDLKTKMILKDGHLALYSDKRLLDLFTLVKGKKDTIETPEGQTYSITYNHPKDLLEAMIYSYKYKKP